jgi:hypothetical protein
MRTAFLAEIPSSLHATQGCTVLAVLARRDRGGGDRLGLGVSRSSIPRGQRTKEASSLFGDAAGRPPPSWPSASSRHSLRAISH